MNGEAYRAPNPYDLSTWRDRRSEVGEIRDGDEVRSDDEPRVPAEGGPPVAPRDRMRPQTGGDGMDRGPAGRERGRDSAEDLDDESLYDPPDLPRDLVDPFELARRTVNQARAAARDRGLFPISARTQALHVRDRSATAPGYSGARPDPRDPQGIQAVLRRVMGNLGWDEGVSSGRVLEEWDVIVGEQVAAHCRPVSLDAGVLVVSASSSAWASQLRMIAPQVITRIHEHVGASVISELTVTGPAARSWKKGRRTVQWRGPRDTYG